MSAELKIKPGGVVAAGTDVSLLCLIILEDGSLVTGATSLVSRGEYISYAASVGTTIADSIGTDRQLVDAMRFINSLEPKFNGVRVERDQALCFPRQGLYYEGWSWGYTEIPEAAKIAQMEVALYINAGLDPYNPQQNKIVTSERVEGAVSVSYAALPGKPMQSNRWEQYLAGLCRDYGQVRMVRA